MRQLAGPAAVRGEKTPEHLMWWRPLVRALPGLKIVAVVRDPRAVAASHLEVPWGIRSHVVLAEQWSFDQRQVMAARATLGRRRCLVLHYEDASPTRTALAPVSTTFSSFPRGGGDRTTRTLRPKLGQQ